MILVDTNVWSEAFRSDPDARVRAWAARNAHQLWLSTVVIGELLSGAALMPTGRRRTALDAAYVALISEHGDRIVPVDVDGAYRYADILAQQQRHGRNPGTADTQIAATALAHGMALATRNTKHFAGLGLILVDPWQE